ncbi:MAG: GNAT family N-acetyltransferase [Deltaproteobacteria bacterium]|nr:GNAT family N-acetyltransferase [Deltaproteobacteria bacterium]
MGQEAIKIRLMRADDFDAVVEVDRKIMRDARPDYYELKFDKLFKSKDYVPASLVAESADSAVVGFVMGELYLGEYGMLQESATLDTIGVDPDFQHQGIGERLMQEFVEHMRSLGVEKIHTLVHWNDSNLIRFFSANSFSPSKTINLELNL